MFAYHCSQQHAVLLKSVVPRLPLPQAASQVSPELAEQLRQHVLAQVEAAALLAAAAGTPFDMAATIHQLLPDLAQQVSPLHEEVLSAAASCRAAACLRQSRAMHKGSSRMGLLLPNMPHTSRVSC